MQPKKISRCQKPTFLQLDFRPWKPANIHKPKVPKEIGESRRRCKMCANRIESARRELKLDTCSRHISIENSPFGDSLEYHESFT